MWFATPKQLLQRAQEYKQKGKLKKATRCLERALKKAPFTDSSLEATLYQELAELYLLLGKLPEALEAIEKSQALGREVEEFPLWKSICLRGEYFLSRGKVELSLANLKESLEFLPEEDQHLGVSIRRSLSHGYFLLGDYPQSLEQLEMALLLDIGDPENLAVTLGQLAYLFALLGQFSLAKEYLSRAQELAKEAFLNVTGYLHFVSGALAYLEKDFVAALHHYQQAKKLWREIEWKRPLVRVELELGYVYAFEKEEKKLRKVLQSLSKEMDAFQAEDLYVSWGFLEAFHENMMGKREEAIETIQAHLTVAQSEGFLEHLWQLEHLEGHIWEELGDLEAARDSYLQALNTLEQILEKLPEEFQESYTDVWHRARVLEDANRLAEQLEEE